MQIRAQPHTSSMLTYLQGHPMPTIGHWGAEISQKVFHICFSRPHALVEELLYKFIVLQAATPVIVVSAKQAQHLPL